MPLDIQGYNEQFKTFVDFANNYRLENGAGTSKIVNLDGSTEFGSRTVKESTNDKVGKWYRSRDIKDVNNMTREVFRNAIAEMYGGEENIPRSVLDAMKLHDYNKGRPLTARRILEVKKAIDQEGTAKVKGETEFKARLEQFDSNHAEDCAKLKGWSQTELPKVTQMTKFLHAATGMSIERAVNELSTPGSKANRLMNYGGRFTESAENFAQGLRLMDSFADWYKKLGNVMSKIKATTLNDDYSHAKTFTHLNFDFGKADAARMKGFEKFIFEDFSVNPNINLSETDPEKLFGMEHNDAMNFFGHNFGSAMTSTIANIPKEKRAVLYAALNVFTDPAHTAIEAKEKQRGDGSKTWISTKHSPAVIARVLKNFDRACELYNTGQLTRENIINEFFSEISDKGEYNYKTIYNHFDKIEYEMSLEDYEGGKYTDLNASKVTLAMENTGCTFEETVQILREGKELPPPPQYLSTGSVPIEAFDGTTSGGRNALQADLYRPANYAFENDTDKQLLPKTYPGFGFNFPNEEKFYTNGKQEGKNNIGRVGDNVEAMCGTVHVNQANNVMAMLSQTGLAPLRGNIPQLNLVTNEHSAVDYTLSKNEENGDIIIKYSSPEDLPVKFEWTATVDVDGNVTTTPLTCSKK